MSTNDVPGAKSSNNDSLHMGCWAEHDDESLIFVEANEGSRVVYSIFDMAEDPIIEYRDAMIETDFKSQFSFKGNNIKWTWHDKTPFPWDKIIKNGARGGVKYPSAYDQLSAAAKVAKSIKARGTPVDPTDYEHLADNKRSKSIISKLQRAIDELRT
jgi:hypothetical protein